MPFITPEQRKKINNLSNINKLKFLYSKLDNTNVGDLCYYFYKDMIKKWKKERRWTTAHNIYKDMKNQLTKDINLTQDAKIAYELAWQVFFNLHVMRYELEKQNENGEID